MSKIASRGKLWSSNDLLNHMRTPLFRNAYALILSSGASSALGVLYWIFAARYYSTEAVGLNSAAISAMIFLSGLAQLNLRTAMVRFIPQAGDATRRLVIRAYLANAILGAIVASIFIAGLGIWAPSLEFLRTDTRSLLWFIFATVGWGIFTLQDAVLTGMRQSLWVPIENTLFSLAKLLLLIIFATSWTQSGIFASWTLPLAFALVPVNILIFRWLMPRHMQANQDRAVPIESGHIIRYIAGDYLGALFALMSTVLLPIIVTQEAGASANAHFYQPWTIAASLQLVAMNMATSLTVEAARDEHQLGIYARHALRSTARLILPAVALIVIGAPYLLRVFGASYATEGSTLLRLLALSTIPNIVVALYLGLERVRRRMRSIMMVQGLLCLLGLSLSYTLLARYGIVGVGWAWLISQTIVASVIIMTQLRTILSVSDHTQS